MHCGARFESESEQDDVRLAEVDCGSRRASWQRQGVCRQRPDRRAVQRRWTIPGHRWHLCSSRRAAGERSARRRRCDLPVARLAISSCQRPALSESAHLPNDVRGQGRNGRRVRAGVAASQGTLRLVLTQFRRCAEYAALRPACVGLTRSATECHANASPVRGWFDLPDQFRLG